MGAVITLTTDFGFTDAYVAAMKGVILSINPEAVIVDICHSIKPQAVSQAAFVLKTVYEYFPPQTIHVVVVDPGVGTDRRAVVLRTPAADFVAPDNGVLSYVIQQSPPKDIDINHRQIELGTGMEAVAITRPQYWRNPVSPTFHGRDIFAPVAAHLSLGSHPMHIGEPITSLTVFPQLQPYQTSDGTLMGHVLHIDNFGNLITNIRSNDLPEPHQEITIEAGDQLLSGLSQTYGEGKGLLALIGSSGYLEISVKEGNAATSLGVGVGDKVKIRPPSAKHR